jgi:hypothetical protein
LKPSKLGLRIWFSDVFCACHFRCFSMFAVETCWLPPHDLVRSCCGPPRLAARSWRARGAGRRFSFFTGLGVPSRGWQNSGGQSTDDGSTLEK